MGYGYLLSEKKIQIFLGGALRGAKRGSKTPFFGVKCQKNVKKLNNSRNLCPIDLNEVLFEFYGLGLSFE